MEGSLHASTFAKVAQTLLGQITRFANGPCTGGTITPLALPWHVRYESFAGALPLISSVSLSIAGLKINGNAFGVNCLYGTATSLARLILNVNSSWLVTGVRADERVTVPLASGTFCPSTATMSGTGLVTALNSPASIRVTLLAPPPPPAIVTVGDSFMSGEAGRWAGNTATLGAAAIDALGGNAYSDEGGNLERIWLCHRSRSWQGGIGVNGVPLTENLACSGAKRTTFIAAENGDFKPGLDFYSEGAERGQALMLKEYALAHPNAIRMVAISIGGNDFGFGQLVYNCVFAFYNPFGGDCRDETFGRRVVEANNLAATVIAVTDGIREVRRAMLEAGYADNSYRLLVENYVSPVPPAELLRRYTDAQRGEIGGCPIRAADLTWTNETVIPQLEWAVWQGAQTTQLPNVARLDVRRAFEGRRLCEISVGLLEENGFAGWNEPGAVDDVEWVNHVRRVDDQNALYRQESVHPNYWGQLALRRCVRLAYNNGAPRSGRCRINGPGLIGGEPDMRLDP
ncbi:MAG TPA: hypothetical protein VFS37_05050 [Conexibacter sp.]|nr:hypothetical protein [Conexibacter sp.]